MRILFVSLSNIGDAIMTTPVLLALEKHFPSAEFDIVAGARSAEVFSHYPKKGRLYIKNKQGFLRGYYDLWKSLIFQSYDLIVDLRFDGFMYLLRGEMRLGKNNGNKDAIHSVEQHMSVIRSIIKSDTTPETHLWLTDHLSNFADDATNSLPRGLWLSVGPGCGGPEKVWRAENFANACNKLKEKVSAILLLGSSGDKEYCQRVSNRLNLPYIDFSGKTNVLQAAALIRKTQCFIGNDSGLGHLASAVGTSTVSLFGVGFPERYHPWQANALWLSGNDKEVNNIGVDEVVQSIEKMLDIK